MCFNETHNRVWIWKHLSDMFLIKNVLKKDVLLPLLFNFISEYTIRRVQVNQNGLKLNGTHQLLVYADDVNVLGGSIYTVMKNTEALVVASKETGLEVNANKTKYMVMFWDQNAGQSHNKRLITFPLKWWRSSNIGEQPYGIKIPFRKKIRADWSQRMLAIMWCRIICLPSCYPKI